MTFAEHVKNDLLFLIQEMASVLWLFSKNPATDFSRSRKLDFASTGSCFLWKVAACRKNYWSIFSFLLIPLRPLLLASKELNCSRRRSHFCFMSLMPFSHWIKKYKGYRLLACDGSDLNIARNPKDADTHFQSLPTDKGFNQLHLNALYDLCERRYTDAVIQPARKKSESLAMTQMVDRCTTREKTIFIADRGYETYNIFAHIQEKGMYYLIRVKDGAAGAWPGGLNFLPGMNLTMPCALY